jgi:hypothetical protein
VILLRIGTKNEEFGLTFGHTFPFSTGLRLPYIRLLAVSLGSSHPAYELTSI